MITDEQIAQMVEADAAGRAWAEALQPGDKFEGCSPEAERRGYKGLVRLAFCGSALDVLDRHILHITREGIILSYTPKDRHRG